MKTTRLLFCAGLMLGLLASGTFVAADPTAPAKDTPPAKDAAPAKAVAPAKKAKPAKKETYAVVGYYRAGTPPAALVEKAQKEIGAKMAAFTPVEDPESADRVVNVMFKRDSYQIYFDVDSPEAVAAQRDFENFYARNSGVQHDNGLTGSSTGRGK